VKARRNIWVLIGVGFLWWFAIGFSISELSGTIGRISDPARADAAEEQYKEATSGIGTVVAIMVAILGTWAGVLPGTRPRLVPLEPKDIETLERLAELRDEGTLSEVEFLEQKARLLGDQIE
jgi:hypothetical protein